jgi:hypothetical protein
MVGIVIAAATFFVVAGCNDAPSPKAAASSTGATSTSTVPSSTAVPPPHLVTQRMIDQYPLTSPQRGLLVWWRAAQFVDYQGYVQSYANGFRQTIRSDPNARGALLALGGFLTASTLKFLEVQRDRPNAVTLYTKIRYQSPGPNGTFALSTLPRAFRMVRQGGTWRLEDDSFAQEVVPAALRR